MTSEQAAASDPSSPPAEDRDPQTTRLCRAQGQIWNLSVFIELRDTVGVSAADHIIGLFKADLSARFLNADSRDALRRDAHAIKSTAGMLGFDELSDLATTLEADCQGDDEVTCSLGELMSARHRVFEALYTVRAVQRQLGCLR